jgi:hypothetical protein
MSRRGREAILSRLAVFDPVYEGAITSRNISEVCAKALNSGPVLWIQVVCQS